MISPERLESMQQQWVRLLAEFNVAPAAAYPLFDRLVAAYSESQRHYHTMEHLAEMFRVANRLIQPSDDKNAMLLAIWYHDYVYDPKRDDNEIQSAIHAARDMETLGINTDLQNHVIRLIYATQHGVLHDQAPGHTVLSDADLAILGASERRYDRYAADIRKEYQHVPDGEYRVGRIKVLKSFLYRRDSIYSHAIMIEEGEAAALANMKREITKLSSQDAL